jgi:starch synthase (maltosyl-transferring)
MSVHRVTMSAADWRSKDRRIIIEHIWPEIECGRYPVKRVVGDTFEVQADVFREGHDLLGVALACARVPDSGARRLQWDEVRMWPLENDRWVGRFPLSEIGTWRYRIAAWTDRFGTWRRDMARRLEAGQVEEGDVLEGLALIDAAAGRMKRAEAKALSQLVASARDAGDPIQSGQILMDEQILDLVGRFPDRSAGSLSRELTLTVDPVPARFSAWYELFPRAQGGPGRHGTFDDVIAQLPHVAGMGFDVLYLPPIHPIGRTNRKGPNNTLGAGPEDVGSPWAIGNEEGGHKSIEPRLGTFEDFDRLVTAARGHGIQIAMDYAIQVSPDHPYVREHPDWFFIRPDGSIKYAENPPKKYQDIYPINFYCADRESLWNELKSIVLFWIERGVTTFRVDNPHTKPIPFWEWLIADVKRQHPQTIFLAEAFTRPNVMRALAKAGFTQSYTYFTWRVTRWELTEYLTELTQSEMKEYFRGNLWPNTPDILHDFLVRGGLPAFKLRLVLAATLSSAYGIYSGYELGINTPLHPGSEEYLNSDKYQLNSYDWDQTHSIAGFIGWINRIRRTNPALHLYDNLRFYNNGANDNIIVYGKSTPDGQNRVLVVVNLDPFNAQETWIGVPFWEWGFGSDEPYQVHDFLTGETYLWRGEYNYIRLDPGRQPAHIFLVTRAGVPTPSVREIDFA